MKSTEHLIDLRALDMSELDARLKEVRTELFNLRFQAATGQLENHRQIRHVRRQIAQVLTVIQGRRLGFEDIVIPSATAETTSGRRASRRAARAVAVGTPAAASVATAEPETTTDSAAGTDAAQSEEQ